jgi:hypothetical protein
VPDRYVRHGRQRHNRQFLEAMYAKLAGADLTTVVGVARRPGTACDWTSGRSRWCS